MADEMPVRAFTLKDGREGLGPVVYWMHRDHRVRDNRGLHHAQRTALAARRPLVVAYCLDPGYPSAAPEHFSFLLGGLAGVREGLAALDIPFLLYMGDPPSVIADLADRLDPMLLVTDFDPLRHKRRWLEQAALAVRAPMVEVDSRNIVPCRAASDKAEYMARTIRPKLKRLLPDLLAAPPRPVAHPYRLAPDLLEAGAVHPDDLARRIGPVSARRLTFPPGEAEARWALVRFIERRLDRYPEDSSNPAVEGQSDLSPYLHFGMIASLRVALDVLASEARQEAKDAFLEQLIVRRELADNFCLHHPDDYDSSACFPAWAAQTLARHADDPRPALYAREELEDARTHDPLWNAAQTELVIRGKMHGYMRMYWCKKILEWTESPDEAMRLAISLNDRYSLDGRDPNGYAGIAWSIGGVHDRPWPERPVFGTVRSMSAKGLRRKFDVDGYIDRIASLRQGGDWNAGGE